jgi:hypothetical protein
VLTLEVSGRGRNAASLARRAVRGPLERKVRMQHATKEPEERSAAKEPTDEVKRQWPARIERRARVA